MPATSTRIGPIVKFRLERAGFRQEGTSLDGLALSSSLSKYSERGEEYVKSLRSLIRGNRLEKLDRAKLSDKADLQGRQCTVGKFRHLSYGLAILRF